MIFFYVQSPSTTFVVMYWLSESLPACLLLWHLQDDLSSVQLWICHVPHTAACRLFCKHRLQQNPEQEALPPGLRALQLLLFWGLEEGEKVQNETKWHREARSNLCSAKWEGGALSSHWSWSSHSAGTGHGQGVWIYVMGTRGSLTGYLKQFHEPMVL